MNPLELEIAAILTRRGWRCIPPREPEVEGAKPLLPWLDETSMPSGVRRRLRQVATAYHAHNGRPLSLPGLVYLLQSGRLRRYRGIGTKTLAAIEDLLRAHHLLP